MGNHNPPTNGIKPGETRNPNGRPKKLWTWAGEIEKVAEEIDTTGATAKERVVRAVFKRGFTGDVQAFKELSNRTDGMPTQKVEQDVNIKSIQKIEDTLQSLGIPNDPS